MDLAKREPRPSTRLGDPAALARLVRSVDGQRPADQNKTVRKRHMVAELCRLMGSQLGDEPPPPPPGADLTGLRPACGKPSSDCSPAIPKSKSLSAWVSAAIPCMSTSKASTAISR